MYSPLEVADPCNMTGVFLNRYEAGALLAEKLWSYRGKPDLVVLGLPRGGVPVAFEVARFLEAPLDVFVVRKLGVPQHPELAMGAVASPDFMLLNENVIAGLGIPGEEIQTARRQEMEVVAERERRYRRGRPGLDLRGKRAILIDDGLATGASMRVAIKALRHARPCEIVVAVPVGPPHTCDLLKQEADDLVCLLTPQPFYGVGMWYVDFDQTSDEEVIELLDDNHEGREDRTRHSKDERLGDFSHH